MGEERLDLNCSPPPRALPVSAESWQISTSRLWIVSGVGTASVAAEPTQPASPRTPTTPGRGLTAAAQHLVVQHQPSAHLAPTMLHQTQKHCGAALAGRSVLTTLPSDSATTSRFAFDEHTTDLSKLIDHDEQHRAQNTAELRIYSPTVVL
jgi:hypothetical protein